MIIYEFDCNSKEKVRISLANFKGKRLIHIRIYEDFQDGRGYSLTKRGISIDIDLASELRKGIDRLFAKLFGKKSRWNRSR